jgi:hypothetical protein
MRTLTFSALRSNAERAAHGIFVETQLRKPRASGQVQLNVVASVPWFPSRKPRFGEYALHASAPREGQRHGIRIRWAARHAAGMIIAIWDNR